MTQDEAPVLTFAFAALKHRAVHIPQESIKKYENMPVVGREEGKDLYENNIYLTRSEIVFATKIFPVQAQATQRR